MKAATALAIKSLHGMKLETDEYFTQLKLTKRAVELLISFNVEHPLKALVILRKKLAANKAHEITVTNLRKWGK